MCINTDANTSLVRVREVPGSRHQNVSSLLQVLRSRLVSTREAARQNHIYSRIEQKHFPRKREKKNWTLQKTEHEHALCIRRKRKEKRKNVICNNILSRIKKRNEKQARIIWALTISVTIYQIRTKLKRLVFCLRVTSTTQINQSERVRWEFRWRLHPNHHYSFN